MQQVQGLSRQSSCQGRNPSTEETAFVERVWSCVIMQVLYLTACRHLGGAVGQQTLARI